MLCLQQCIDMCDLTPEEVNALGSKASLHDIMAAQSACPRQHAAASNDTESGVHCELLPQIR